MANKPINMLQLRRILQLKLHGKSNREIAFELRKSRDTVNGYVKQLSLIGKSFEDLLKLNDEELSSLAFNEPSCVKTHWRFADLQQRTLRVISRLIIVKQQQSSLTFLS